MADEIVVEGEPWTGLIVVQDDRWGLGLQYRYGLVQASEWKWTGDPKDPDREVTVWKGPEKPDEKIKRRDLSEVECRTVLVNKEGFYTCPPVINLIRDEVLKVAEEEFDIEANERAAETQSYIDHEEYSEKYGDDILAVARFGDAVAVNGESGYQRSKIVPKGWVKLEDEGGVIPGGHEEQVDVDHIVERISEDLTEELKRPIDQDTVREIILKEYGYKGYVMWQSDSGDSSIYMPRKALKDYEKKKEEIRLADEEESRKRRAAQIEREAEERKRQAEERKQKIRRGGFPRPKDWSPTGETDFTPPRE